MSIVEFASGNMYGPIPALAALADLGVRSVRYQLVDKEYDAWLKTAAEYPFAPPAATPSAQLPHQIDFGALWKAWEGSVHATAEPHDKLVPTDAYTDTEGQPVRDLVMATLETGQQRITDAAAQLYEVLAFPSARISRWRALNEP